jgi:23S rRNA G2445 N2-methylase RlmL
LPESCSFARQKPHIAVVLLSVFLAKPQRFLVRPAPGWLDVAGKEVREIIRSPVQKYKFAPIVTDEDGLIVVSDCDYRQALEIVCRVTTVHDVEWVIHSGRITARSEWASFFEKSGVGQLWSDVAQQQVKLAASVSHPIVGTEKEIKELAQATWPQFKANEHDDSEELEIQSLQRIRIEASKNRHRILVSMGGEPLFKRGYKITGLSAVAPLPEHHASACFLWATSVIQGWSLNDLRDLGCAFVTPFAGTGTTCFESLARLFDVAPALTRQQFACENFAFHPAATMATIRQRLRRHVQSPKGQCCAVLGDINDEVVTSLNQQSESFLRACGVSISSSIMTNDFLERPLELTKALDDVPRLFFPLNPPFGQRLAKSTGSDAIYRKLGRALELCATKYHFAGYVLCPDESSWRHLLASAVSLNAETHHFTHGGTDMRVVAFSSRN